MCSVPSTHPKIARIIRTTRIAETGHILGISVCFIISQMDIYFICYFLFMNCFYKNRLQRTFQFFLFFPSSVYAKKKTMILFNKRKQHRTEMCVSKV